MGYGMSIFVAFNGLIWDNINCEAGKDLNPLSLLLKTAGPIYEY
jgi:hypothetical protein